MRRGYVPVALGVVVLALAVAVEARADDVAEGHVTAAAAAALSGDAERLGWLHETAQDPTVATACRLYADRALAAVLVAGQHRLYPSPALLGALAGIASDLHVYAGYCRLSPNPPPAK